MIALSEFAARRTQLMQQMEQDSIALVVAAPERFRNADAEYPYRQDSTFWYLTGFPEPEAVAVFIPSDNKYVLFCRDRDKTMEIWNGFRAGQTGAVDDYAADEAYSINDIDKVLPQLLENKSQVYAELGEYADFDQQLLAWIDSLQGKVRMGSIAPTRFTQLSHLVNEMRLHKSAAEQNVMRHAASISAGAHVRAMQAVKPGMWEYQLEAEYLHEFMRHGARSPAYTTIVGGGANGCILHYVENNQALKAGDLVLVDAGCEYQSYASDITRTFPVSGKFSSEQQALYEVVLAAQIAAIEASVVGAHYHSGHEQAVQILTQGLCDLGLLQGDVSDLVETGAYRDFYMHGTGHWLGLDVHDVGLYRIDGKSRPLQEGMVLTVEPGLYVAADNQNVDEKWRGIGIRIEDDIIIQPSGPEVITSDVPKTIADIEALMAGKL